MLSPTHHIVGNDKIDCFIILLFYSMLGVLYLLSFYHSNSCSLRKSTFFSLDLWIWSLLNDLNDECSDDWNKWLLPTWIHFSLFMIQRMLWNICFWCNISMYIIWDTIYFLLPVKNKLSFLLFRQTYHSCNHAGFSIKMHDCIK